MVKKFSGFDIDNLERKCTRFLNENPEKRIVSWKLSAKYDKKLRCVIFRILLELTD